MTEDSPVTEPAARGERIEAAAREAVAEYFSHSGPHQRCPVGPCYVRRDMLALLEALKPWEPFPGWKP